MLFRSGLPAWNWRGGIGIYLRSASSSGLAVRQAEVGDAGLTPVRQEHHPVTFADRYGRLPVLRQAAMNGLSGKWFWETPWETTCALDCGETGVGPNWPSQQGRPDYTSERKEEGFGPHARQCIAVHEAASGTIPGILRLEAQAVASQPADVAVPPTARSSAPWKAGSGLLLVTPAQRRLARTVRVFFLSSYAPILSREPQTKP